MPIPFELVLIVLLSSIVLGSISGMFGANIVHYSLLHRVTAAESFLRALTAANARTEKRLRDKTAVEKVGGLNNASPFSPEEIMRRGREQGIVS